MSEPIMITCEGSNCPGHPLGDGISICAMCGQHVAQLLSADGRLRTHDRDDVIARIIRGDFG